MTDKNDTHEGSQGTDRLPPSGTEDKVEKELSEEELLKLKIEELRRRDPFIYN